MQCYCAATRRVARRLTRMYEAEMLASGMSPAQFELMNYLKSQPQINQATLAEAMDVDQTTLSRNLKILVGQGWVKGSVGAKDRRVSTYALTKSGSGALKKAMTLWEQAHMKVQSLLSEDDLVWRVLKELGSAASV